MKRRRMPKELALSGLFLLVFQVSQSMAGVRQFSAYGNATRQGYFQPRNGSNESTGIGRAMSSGSHRNIFDALYDKSVDSKVRITPVQPPKQAVASDRFTPGEAYGGTVYKIQKAKHEKRKGYQYQKPNAASLDSNKKQTTVIPPPASSVSPAIVTITVPVIPSSTAAPKLPPIIEGPTPLPSTTTSKPSDPTTKPSANSLPDAPVVEYIPPSDPNLFPPNIHSHYPPVPANGETRFSGLTSYLPPAMGPVADSNITELPPSNQYIPPAELFQFPPNIHSHYQPHPMKFNIQTNGLTSYLPPPAGPTDTYLPPPPEPSTDPPKPAPPSSSDTIDDTIGTIPIGPETPYPAYLPPKATQSTPPPAPKPQMMMGMHPTPNMAMGMPQTPSMIGPPMAALHDFHGYKHHHPHEFFPEYIFDHDFHHHHHHHDEPTTTEPPPPPPAKVKNYNYYYISRVFWYFPLYFTLYFAIYIVILILRDLSRYKVNYPNRLAGFPPTPGWDKIVTRSLDDMHFLTNEQAALKADITAKFIMKQIEEFKDKYLG